MREFLTSHKEYIGTSALAALIVFVFFLIYISGGDRAASLSDSESGVLEDNIAEGVDPFTKVVLEANAAYVLDISSGQRLFAYNSDAQLPLASLAKIMTAVAALDIIPADTDVVIRDEDVFTEGDSGLIARESWSRDKLAAFMLLVSSNDAASAMANAANLLLYNNPIDQPKNFVEAMNAKAKLFGMNQTFFLNSTGLDISPSVGGAYGSAHDVAILMQQALRELPKTIAKTSNESLRFFSENNISHNAENTNIFVGSIPGLVASKTGYTPLAGGNLAIVVDTSLNRPITVVVLGSTRDGRFRDAILLVSAAYKSLTAR